jgi:hypothetical protein
VSGRLKPLHASFPLAGRLVGMVRAVVEVAVLPMFDAGEDLARGRTLAPQLIGHDHPWGIASVYQQLAEACLGGCRSALALYKHVEDIALLVHSPPAIALFTTDRQQHRIQMSHVARSRAPTAYLMGRGWPARPAPIPHRHVRQDDAAFGPQRCNVPATEAETNVQPDTMADDLCRKPMALIPGDW